VQKAVGLALGSGGARGWAHIGVIRALEAADISVDAIAGASIGALVGAVHAAGELDALETLVRELTWREIVSYFDVVFPTSGLLDGNRVYDLLSEHLQALKIEKARIPFCCVATDLSRGQEICLNQGRMVDAVRASISIPGIFTPFEKDGTLLGDGGIVNPVPVSVARRMGVEVVVAVNLNCGAEANPDLEPGGDSQTGSDSPEGQTPPPDVDPATAALGKPNTDGKAAETEAASQEESGPAIQLLTRLRDNYATMQETLQEKINGWMPEGDRGPNIFDVIGMSLNVMEQHITQSQLAMHPPDILIQPPLMDYSIFDFHQAADIIQLGYEYTQRQIPELKRLLT
jgi:NTE family protein